LRVPTLAVFNWANTTHFHHHPWVQCVTLGKSDDAERLATAAEGLSGTGWSVAKRTSKPPAPSQ